MRQIAIVSEGVIVRGEGPAQAHSGEARREDAVSPRMEHFYERLVMPSAHVSFESLCFAMSLEPGCYSWPGTQEQAYIHF